MMKKVLLKINHESELTYPSDGYVLGINDFSYLFEKSFSVDEIKKIKENNPDKLIFVSFNKIIFNDELCEYKKALKEVDELTVDGIIIGDIAALTYELNTNIILDQMHLNNSYYTINHYFNNGVSGVVLSNDITKDEISSIRENTKAILFKQVFGYTHLSTSNRFLITNYLKHFNICNKSFSYEICENNSNDYYKVIEDNFGTHILSSKPLNLLGYDIDVDYEIVDGYLINDIKDVLVAFYKNDVSKKEDIDKKYNADSGFISKETIYKVKNDEK